MWCSSLYLFLGVVAVQFSGKAECEIHCLSLFRVSISVNAVMLFVKTIESL